MMYRKKPIEIEARQWDGSHDEKHHLIGWIRQEGGDVTMGLDPASQLAIDTLEGPMLVSPGDYVIQGIKGEFYPCKPDIFEASYDAVEDDE